MSGYPGSRERLRDQTHGDEYGQGVYEFAVFLEQHGFVRPDLDPFEVALWHLEARTSDEMEEMDESGQGR